MSRGLFLIALGLILTAKPAFAVEFKCSGQEKGINTLTGKERVLPVSYRIKIINDHASISGFEKIKFTARENNEYYFLSASIGKTKLLGEYALRIDKRSGHFNGKSWLLSRENVTTTEGQCEKIIGR